MDWRQAAILTAASLLAACVTERSGLALPEPSDEEAAQLNLELGAQYLKQNELQAAQIKLEKALEQNPKLITAYITLARVYERLEDTEEAERLLKRAVKLSPNDPEALNSYAAFLCGPQDRREEGLVYFDRAIQVRQSVMFSNKAMLNTNAGICAKPLDLARAEDYLRTALRLDPDFSEAMLQLADVAHRRGNHLQGRAFLERYLSAAPASPPALWLGVEIERALGDFDAAEGYAQRLRKDYPGSVQTRRLLEQERNAG